jgi:hypothetical protein
VIVAGAEVTREGRVRGRLAFPAGEVSGNWKEGEAPEEVAVQVEPNVWSVITAEETDPRLCPSRLSPFPRNEADEPNEPFDRQESGTTYPDCNRLESLAR